VHAVIRCKKGQCVIEADLQQLCREHLAGYKVPKSVDFIDKEFPKTPVGKLDKGELKRAVMDRRF
jgi:long-chain acyl-CoA synthetase